MNDRLTISFIGSGRLATQLAMALSRSSCHTIRQVCSPTAAHAQALADKVGAEVCSDVGCVAQDADVYVVAVRDDVLPDVLGRLSRRVCGGAAAAPVILHTAGSVPMSVFDTTVSASHGVLYPMQTFSMEREVDFRHVPFFIEGSDAHALSVARALASSVSDNVREMSSAERRYLHVAAVLACNFSNHLYTLADRLLREHGMDISVMLPLIRETVDKLTQMPPALAQTGPAARRDMQVMAAHEALLDKDKTTQQLYQLLSRSIMESMDGGTRH